MCVFVSLIAIVGVLYFNHQDKANGKREEIAKNKTR